ncbi:MAG TPA: hypothetical protein DCZ75_16090 [Geobacter sp.]|nr:hypothetical protein [Geobacter sp.]
MSIFAVMLPFLCLAALLRVENLRESFITSATVTAVYVVLSTELLSRFNAVAKTPVLVCWSAYLLLLVAWRYCSKGAPDTNRCAATTTLYQKTLLALLICVVGTAGIVAIVAAPNNFDSLTYHLPRVMHWIQNRSVQHYPTHIDRQLVLAPFSEFVILHLHLLSGGDRFDNCVQWFSMIGSAIGVSLIVSVLRGSLNSQIVAAAIAVSLPMGLLQSTSTQNDYVVTFWLVTLCYYVIKGKQSPAARDALPVGASLALAIFTKGTAYLVALPFMLVYAGYSFRNRVQTGAANLLVLTAAIALINGSHYARNLEIYGNPLSPGTGNDIVCSNFGITSAVSSVAKNVATQLGSGIQGANLRLQALTRDIHTILATDVNDPALTTGNGFFLLPARNHEDFAPNPLHMTLMLFGAAALFRGRKNYSRETVVFAITAMLSFVVLSMAIKWNPFISRYFLPVFVVSAPFLALIYEKNRLRPFIDTCALLLLIWSFSILANNEMRPLVGRHSVLATEREDQYFMSRPQAKQYFTATTNMIKMQPLANVGILDRDSNMWEYILWVQLNDARGKFRIEHVEVQNASGRLKLQRFSNYLPVMI